MAHLPLRDERALLGLRDAALALKGRERVLLVAETLLDVLALDLGLLQVIVVARDLPVELGVRVCNTRVS